VIQTAQRRVGQQSCPTSSAPMVRVTVLLSLHRAVTA
jgi:hypothetical protein